MRAVPRLLSYTLAFALQLRKITKNFSFFDRAALGATTDCNLQHSWLGLHMGQVTHGQRKYLQSCRTKGFPASADFESKLSVRAMMWWAKTELPNPRQFACY
jgi:hypothetical protein